MSLTMFLKFAAFVVITAATVQLFEYLLTPSPDQNQPVAVTPALPVPQLPPPAPLPPASPPSPKASADAQTFADKSAGTARPTPAPVPPKPKPAPAPRPEAIAPLPEVAAETQPVPPPLSLSDRQFYERFSGAAIQIYCTTAEELFAASGVILNDRGLVLTNAHVAEIVLESGETNCRARHGNPADPFAKLQVIFTASTTPKIPDTNIPQRDFAFLRLVEPTEPFRAAETAITLVEPGTTLLTLGYPSEFLESIAASANSNLVFSVLRVEGYADADGDLTTAEGYVFRGGLVLQRGSSGTALFGRDGPMVGLIFATTKGATTAEREGIALTTPYIDRILRLETGQGLKDFIESH